MSGPPTLEVLHADNHVVVVVKPAGLGVVPDESGDESLFDRVRAWVEHTYQKPGRAFLGVVHRLDRPVSGVVAFARTSKSAARLTRAFAERRVEKTYWGLVSGAPEPPAGELEQWLRKDRSRNRVHVVAPESDGSKVARTRWRTLGAGPSPKDRAVLVELTPVTGRSHQLRVAMAALKRPLLGDLKYGAERALPDRSIALHARRLAFEHPTTKAWLEFEARAPALDVWDVAARAQDEGRG